MKVTGVFLGMLLMTSSVTANDTKQLAKSFQAWQKVKAECGGNYNYHVQDSGFIGYQSRTEIVVKNNKVVERRYHDGSAPEVKWKWIETGKTLGTHKEGAALLTVDALYKEAEKALKHEVTSRERWYFQLDGRGLLKNCYYGPDDFDENLRTAGAKIHRIVIGGQ